MSFLVEYQSPESFTTEITESVDNTGAKKKHMYMKGLFLQGDIRNRNNRIYPSDQIQKSVESIRLKLSQGETLCGELDHPDGYQINLDRVSHSIEDIWMEGSNGYGKLKIIPTEMGKIAFALLENGIKLGVSSRGSGDVDEFTGRVSDFSIVTIDIVAQPSAPNAYPKAIMETMMNRNHGYKTLEILAEANLSPTVQNYFKKQIMQLIEDLQRN